jgi:hypothetical protein
MIIFVKSEVILWKDSILWNVYFSHLLKLSKKGYPNWQRVDSCVLI